MIHTNGTKLAAKTREKSRESGAAVVMVSPLNGARSPTGAHPGNTGGKPGRSGRRPDAFKARLEAIRDEHGLPVLEEILGGAAYPPEARLRAVDLSMRYTLGLEKTIRLEGPFDVARAFDRMKDVIRRQLAPETAALIIDSIHEELRHL